MEETNQKTQILGVFRPNTKVPRIQSWPVRFGNGHNHAECDFKRSLQKFGIGKYYADH